MQRLPIPLRPSRLAALCLVCSALPLSSPLLAAPSPCQPPPPAAQLLLSGLAAEKTGLPGGFDAALRLQRSLIAWQSAAPQRGIALGYGHEYSIMDLQTPQDLPEQRRGNGHFHQLFLPVDLSAVLPEGWSLRLQPALAVTSNQLRHPDELETRDWQLSAALLRSWDSGQGDRWEIGLCGDSRFGEPRLYPSVAWTRETATWSLRLGLPDSAFSRRVGANLDAGLRLFPDGNRWRVHADDAAPSWHEHEGWRAELLLGWEPLRQWRLEAGLGTWLDNRHRFELLGGQRVESDGGASAYARLALVWRPRG